MNIIKKHPANEIGYNFIEPAYLPKGKNEYHLRNLQNSQKKEYFPLTEKQAGNILSSGCFADF